MISTSEQLAIQEAIDKATAGELTLMRRQAEHALVAANNMSGLRTFSAEERIELDIAVEILTRLDAKVCNGGWWYRSKRRLQIIAMYLGG